MKLESGQDARTTFLRSRLMIKRTSLLVERANSRSSCESVLLSLAMNISCSWSLLKALFKFWGMSLSSIAGVEIHKISMRLS
jgi:hypothetical protein